jgi:hypothetical protein
VYVLISKWTLAGLWGVVDKMGLVQFVRCPICPFVALQKRWRPTGRTLDLIKLKRSALFSASFLVYRLVRDVLPFTVPDVRGQELPLEVEICFGSDYLL